MNPPTEVHAAHEARPTRPHHCFWPRRLPREVVAPETALIFNLEVSDGRYPDKAAYPFFGQPLSDADLLTQAQAVAGCLRAHGVHAGDWVLVFIHAERPALREAVAALDLRLPAEDLYRVWQASIGHEVA